MILISGTINNQSVKKFDKTSREEKLLLKEFKLFNISKKNISEILNNDKINILNKSSIKLEFSPHTRLEDSSDNLLLDFLRDKYILKNGDMVDVEIYNVELNYSQEDILSVMIYNPINKPKIYSPDLVTIFKDETNTIECQFEKIKAVFDIYSTETTLAIFNLTSSYYDDNNQKQTESRNLQFDLYGGKMISSEQLICTDEFLEIMKKISKLTGKKYTFHNSEEPVFTVTGDNLIFWSK